MTPAVVVDVGNTRLKWGRCREGAVAAVASLPPDDREAWASQADEWLTPQPDNWAVAGVHPQRRDAFVDWVYECSGDAVVIIDDPAQLPLRVLLEHPEWVGIDRLLDAVAANSRRRPGAPAILIDAGSAVTVDLVDEAGAFRGGAILPGLRLMAQSLHDYTALLPLIDVPRAVPSLPGASTRAALEAGIFWAVAGGISALIERYAAAAPALPEIYLTGGDAPLLRPALRGKVVVWPEMTLEGIRLTAESLP
jgi:type III pantothenate kinase